MNKGPITIRYAKAIFNLAKDKKLLDQVYKNLQEVGAVYHENPDWQAFLQSPIIPASKKKETFKSIFANNIDDITYALLNMVVDNKRESLLANIILSFERFYRENRNIQTVHITSAVKMDNALKQQVLDMVKKTYQSEVELEEKTDPNIIGGFVMRVGDLQYDASVATQLNNIKQQFLNTTVQSK